MKIYLWFLFASPFIVSFADTLPIDFYVSDGIKRMLWIESAIAIAALYVGDVIQRHRPS